MREHPLVPKVYTRFRRAVKHVGHLIAVALVCGCQAQTLPSAGMGTSAAPRAGLTARSADELRVVDCLIPGQMRKLGRQVVYVTPRRPMKTTALDCEIRGGEYVAYDRADYRTALNVWLSEAEKGDPQAQTYVGEIHERGLGTPPNYVEAAGWYRKAAEQGYSRAQINLGHLYEEGLGVERDPEAAVNWYRRGSGLREAISLEGTVSTSALAEELTRLREELARRTEELETLRKKLESYQEKPAAPAPESSEIERMRDQLAALEAEVEQLQLEKGKVKPAIDRLPTVDLGGYYALLIGNNDYAHFPVLTTAINDAKAVDRILKRRYGFRTRVLFDASEYDILSALLEFQNNLMPSDNLLVYYAGHGHLDLLNERGYWLPIDAEKRNIASWIPNEAIADMLNTMAARHILVVADSCYSGTMSGLSVSRLRPGMPAEVLFATVEKMVKTRSRTVLTSGGLAPVSDVGGGDHSIFAEVLLEILEQNADIIQGKDLHDDVAPRVSFRAQERLGVKQEPSYAALQRVGHEGGDFFFVPVEKRAWRIRDRQRARETSVRAFESEAGAPGVKGYLSAENSSSRL